MKKLLSVLLMFALITASCSKEGNDLLTAKLALHEKRYDKVADYTDIITSSPAYSLETRLRCSTMAAGRSSGN